ncbi:BolA family protein [Halomonas denitrificans]
MSAERPSGIDPEVTARRVAMIRERIEAALDPDALDVIDESHLHVGHPGARDGRGHFRVRIRSEELAAQSRIARHRSIYAALGDLMTTDIHALAIDVED